MTAAVQAPSPVPARAPRPIPALVIAGFLGAGKTTLLRGWLAERPAHERWAVLVNEFGALGVDRALVGGDGDGDAVGVVEVAGGCACCAAQVALRTSLLRLLRRGPWDRLFVETTGLGHPAELIDRLRAKPFEGLIEVLPPVAVVDATRAALYLDPSRPAHERAVGQLELARLLVLNRANEAGEAATAELSARLGALPPWSRATVATGDGTVPLATVLEAIGAEAIGAEAAPDGSQTSTGAGHSVQRNVAVDAGAVADGPSRAADETSHVSPVRTAEVGASSVAVSAPAAPVVGRGTAALPPAWRASRAEPHAASLGWRWPASTEFDRAALQAALEALAGPQGPLRACGLLRAKGVFRTARAWYAWQWVEGRSHWAETAWRTDSRLEVLAEGSIDPHVVEQALQAAVGTG